MAATQGGAAAAGTHLPPLVTVTNHVALEPRYLFMCTNSLSTFKNESLFRDPDGDLVYRLTNNSGILLESKELKDGQDRTILRAKKFPLSLAKWTITQPSSDAVLAKTRTVSGMAKYGVEVDVPSAPRSDAKSTISILPDLSNSRVVMIQNNGKHKPDTPMCVATYGENVAMGMISAAVQDWTYHVVLDPGADAALACLLLVCYTDLIEWNAMGAANW
ncbi:hypothetical protein D9Q98_003248 [Chlorella vulgaris]|uniref:Uncharacterized protein n=1 Tax=Chlorella vulgaris TaxID=3077 RepID=A0A9D4TSS1_CHLVU|nr:hypothetical protein D9Q98_003248 [Chlorella vulgaris]